MYPVESVQALSSICEEAEAHREFSNLESLIQTYEIGSSLRQNLCYSAKQIAENIAKISDVRINTGALDISFYRDDLTHESDQPVITKADIGADVNDKNVVLVDDVLYTGRTARAAIEAVFTAGRPRSIQFAVLVDRGHRELPIRADYVGKNVPTSRAELIEVRLPEFDGETGVYLMEIE